MNWWPVIIVGAGVFSIVGAALDWDRFMTHRKAHLLVSLFGRNGERLFYIPLGAVLIGVGAAAMMRDS